MASMIQKRLAEAMGDRIDPAQFGFRKSRSTSQPIHIYRRIQEIHEEAGLELVTILLDWEKAFDKIHQTTGCTKKSRYTTKHGKRY